MSGERLKDSALVAVGDGLERKLPHHEFSDFGRCGVRTICPAEFSTYKGVFVDIGKCLQRDILEVKSRTNFIPCYLLDSYAWEDLFWLRCLKVKIIDVPDDHIHVGVGPIARMPPVCEELGSDEAENQTEEAAIVLCS